MADFAVTLSAAQVRAMRRLDAGKTAAQVLQSHVDTWLAPYVSELDEVDRRDVLTKYLSAAPAVRDQVKALLDAK